MQYGFLEGLATAFRISGVPFYCSSYAFNKTVNYSLFFWLPFFLEQGPPDLNKALAAQFAALFDVGVILGALAIGLISDWLSVKARRPIRAPACITLLACAVLPLLLLRSATQKPAIAIAVLLAGVLLGGPAEAATSMAACDLGAGVNGDLGLISTVTGVIDGCGAIGAAVGQLLVAYISSSYGWRVVFEMLVCCCVLSALCLLPIARKEILLLREGQNADVQEWQETKASLELEFTNELDDIGGEGADLMMQKESEIEAACQDHAIGGEGVCDVSTDVTGRHAQMS